MLEYSAARELILGEVRTSLEAVDPIQVEQFIGLILSARKVFVIGVGRVMLSMQAMAKRFHHLGIDVHGVGDITEPAITQDDILVIGSGSGESVVPVAIACKAKNLGASIVHVGSNPQSSLAPITDLFVRIPVQTKLHLDGEIESRQIMSSLFEQSLLLFGDCVALMIADRKQLDLKTLWHLHANLE